MITNNNARLEKILQREMSIKKVSLKEQIKYLSYDLIICISSLYNLYQKIFIEGQDDPYLEESLKIGDIVLEIYAYQLGFGFYFYFIIFFKRFYIMSVKVAIRVRPFNQR